MRDEDLLGRIGGDEFAAFVFCDDADPVAAAADRRDQRHGASACAGIAVAPRDGNDAEALLGAADVALRLTKRGGTPTSAPTTAPRSRPTAPMAPKPRSDASAAARA